MVIALAAGLAVALVIAASALILALRLQRELRVVQRASAALGSTGLAGLDQVLREQDLLLRQVDGRAGELDRRLAGAEERLAQAIRRVGIVRFNPFRGTGGDQSFVIALLSEEGSGVVLTGLHNRTDTRIYAKPVQQGASRYPLSDEEAEAIRVALGASRDGVGV